MKHTDIIVTDENVLVNDNTSGEEIINDKFTSARIETNHKLQHGDFSKFDLVNVPELPNEGELVELNKVYKENGIIFVCVQEHTRTIYTAIDTPALFRQYRKQGAEWVQPLGAHDAYHTGDIVTQDGTKYISIIDNNVWSPNAYPQGWKVKI